MPPPLLVRQLLRTPHDIPDRRAAAHAVGQNDRVTGPRPAALLLTGGASRRMGRDKALIDIDGRALCLRTADLLAEVADPVVEVGSGLHPAAPGRRGPPWLRATSRPWQPEPASSTQAGHRGPTLVVATDLPRLTAGLLELLASWPGSGTVVPLASGRPQPLCARYRSSDLALAAALGRGRAPLGDGPAGTHRGDVARSRSMDGRPPAGPTPWSTWTPRRTWPSLAGEP